MEMDGEQEPFAIFLSHSSKDRNSGGDHMRKFVNKVRDVICSKAGIENPDRAVFFDESSIRMGDEWTTALAVAVRTSRIMVCLVSPRFLNSNWCGREVEVFHRRHVRLENVRDPANATGFVFPLIWEVDVRRTSWPLKLSKFQFREAGIPDDYLADGLAPLIRKRRWGKVEAVIDIVGKRIAEKLAGPDQLPDEATFDDFDSIANGFDDEPQPYDLVVIPAVRNGLKSDLGKLVANAASALRTCFQMLAADATQPDIQRHIDARQILLAIVDASESPLSHPMLSNLNSTPSPNLAVLLLDQRVNPGGQPTPIADWANDLPDGALQQAVREQRAAACFRDGIEATIEVLVTKTKLALLEKEEGAKVIDPAISADALRRGLSIATAPLLTGPSREGR